MPNRCSLLLTFAGWSNFLRTMLCLVAPIGLAIAEFVLFRGLYCAMITIILTSLGWYFRKAIMKLGKNYSRHSRRFLLVYGLCLPIASRAGLGVQFQLAIIAFACTVVFNLNFWSITEAALVWTSQRDQDSKTPSTASLFNE